MNEGSFQPLQEVLSSPSAFEWTEWLYLPRDTSTWSESTTTFAIDDSLMAEDVPEPATKAGLVLGLAMQTVQDVVMVLNEAVGGAASMGQLVQALVYYAEYDAFCLSTSARSQTATARSYDGTALVTV